MGSERLATPSVIEDNMADLPGYCALTFTLMPVGSTPQRSVQVLGFASMGPLTPPCRLYPLPVRQASALPTASSGFHLAIDTLAVQLTLPLAGCVGDLHPQVSTPCRAHQRKGARQEFLPRPSYALRLENELAAEFQVPGIPCTGDLAELTGAEAVVEIVVLGMVERVERFEAKLEVRPLCQRE
jgi:hypothetical protein